MADKKKTLERFVVKLRFFKSRPDEMDLDQGDVVLVSAKFNDGWFKGIRLRGYKVGYFPEDVVEKESLNESCNGIDTPPSENNNEPCDIELTGDETMVDNEENKELDKNAKRTKAAEEILSTEVSYCTGLELLVENFIQPMKIYGILSIEEIDTIFSNIESLAGISREMVSKLKVCLENWDVETSLIGDVLLEMFSYLKMFKPYFDSRSAANQMRIRYEKSNDRFRNFLSKVQCGQTLDSLLLMPIQRIPRYELLLKELVKRTEPEHPDYENLSEALSKARETATDLNEHIRQIENESKIFEIINMFPNDELDLIISDSNNSPKMKPSQSVKSKTNLEVGNGVRRSVSLTDLNRVRNGSNLHHAPSDPAIHRINGRHKDPKTHIFKTRMFIHEGAVQKVVFKNTNVNQSELPQEYSDRYLILFSDVAIVAVSAGNVLTGNKFKLKERINLAQCWVADAETFLQKPVPDETFVLGTPRRTYVFLAQSVKEKLRWEKLLQQRIAVEKTKLLELWKYKTVPDVIFVKTTGKSRVEYQAMNENELNLHVNEDVNVIGFRKNGHWLAGLYDPDNSSYDFIKDWLPGVNSMGKFGWFPAECIHGNFQDNKEKSVDQFSYVSVATALQIKHRMAELTNSKIQPKFLTSVKVHKADGTFRTCKLNEETTTEDIINGLDKHNRMTGLNIEKDRIELWEESKDGSVKRKHKHNEKILEILSFWGEYDSHISFVSRTRGVKDTVLDTLAVEPAPFESDIERRRGSHSGSFATRSNSRKEFKKSSSFCS
ncbi:uncharacterized protein LOC114536033 isoform X2 [Dendronephthya gigantea]|uniref:uncharacterized protein LOC114536033 isoform X2 n=1 Tax=Dendronephthya gigantea TaxID=151771 RepID=UPI00106A1028|nr:uncharacterized protein LOC114536033 isoform X2 [Dendronephthya gigantea]